MRVLFWLFSFPWPLAAFRDFGADLDGEASTAQRLNELARDASGNAGSDTTAGSEGVPHSAASTPKAAPLGGKKPGFFDDFRRDIVMQPGKSGILIRGSTITSVKHKSRGEAAGLKAEDRLAAIDGVPFKAGRLFQIERGEVPYALTVVSPSAMKVITRQVIASTQFPAALMGCLLLAGMIPAHRCHQRMGSDWQDDPIVSWLVSPSAMVSAGAFACGNVIEAFSFWPSDVIRRFSHAALAVYIFGVIHCLVSARASPLLATPLPEIAIARWRSQIKVIWLVITVAIVMEITRVAQRYADCQGIRDLDMWKFVARRFAYTLVFIFQLEVSVVITRVAVVVEHRVQQIQNAMTCNKADFPEQVHKACAKLVNETGPQLAPLGFPLLWFTLNLLRNGIETYRVMKTVVMAPARILDHHDQLILATVLCADSLSKLIPVVTGPLRLSSALDELSERLNEARCNDPEMHAQVHAVEAMLKQANNGRGFGIKVWPGLVVSKELLQSACVRAALVATAVVAFLDSKMGFDKAEAELAQVPKIQRMLTNTTAYMQKHN